MTKLTRSIMFLVYQFVLLVSPSVEFFKFLVVDSLLIVMIVTQFEDES